MANCGCGCVIFIEELIGAAEHLILNGNCINCGHAVNQHSRRPTPAEVSPQRQHNMRTQVIERNRTFWYADDYDNPGYFRCDICQRETNKKKDFINSHVIAHAHARTLRIARKSNPKLVSSPSYDSNGLFLCHDCDGYFEDHTLIITGDGTIHVKAAVIPSLLEVYDKLHNTKVRWASRIGIDASWPTAELLSFRNTLVPVCSNHRLKLCGVEPDDRSTASDDSEEEEVSGMISKTVAAASVNITTGQKRKSE